jgi:beta-1,4-mannosyltransferase
MTNRNKRSAAILVLGDLNRSPRMLNHSKAISQEMPEVDEVSLIGFNGGELRSDISLDKKIKIYFIPEKINNLLKRLPRILFILSAFIRIILQIFFLFYLLLFKIPRPEFLILQNPPGIPAMFICWIVCFIRRSLFVIDWHNYGYTILQVNGRNKFITYIARIYEKFFGKFASINLCVSEAMKKHLKNEMNINAINLPDRAIKNVFRRLNINESHQLFERYNLLQNQITEIDEKGEVKFKTDRPLLIVSSTSWTPDEDFDLLLESLIETENNLLNSNDYFEKNRKVLFIITGRGPMKDSFMRKVEQTNLKIFNIKSIWLESDDYPKLLGTADLGVCLHYSSSGFDLPMKVVDMFSAQLPVASFNYETIHELIIKDYNGFLFNTREELSNIFEEVIKEYSFNNNNEKIEKFRTNLQNFSKYDWITQWRETAKSVIMMKSKLKTKNK